MSCGISPVLSRKLSGFFFSLRGWYEEEIALNMLWGCDNVQRLCHAMGYFDGICFELEIISLCFGVLHFPMQCVDKVKNGELRERCQCAHSYCSGWTDQSCAEQLHSQKHPDNSTFTAKSTWIDVNEFWGLLWRQLALWSYTKKKKKWTKNTRVFPKIHAKPEFKVYFWFPPPTDLNSMHDHFL